MKGTTAHAAMAGATATIGARKKRILLAPVGTICSFMRSLMASAIGCSTPFQPTRLGPLRTWIQPITQRSTSW
jgi:hypothetical protein